MEDAEKRKEAAEQALQVAQGREASAVAREEAALGFPVLFEVTIPALLRARDQGMSLQYAQLQALFHTMAALDDTNLVSRGGMDGLRWVQAQARSFLAEGGMAHADGEARACAMHAAFVARHLSPGGSADLLAAACWAIRIGETA